MHKKKISIIGLGLIGGSLARAFRERLGITDITAVDADVRSLQSAIHDNVIRRGCTEPDEGVWNSDVIFLCTPVKTSLAFIDMAVGHAKSDCIITDVCSTKAEVVAYTDSLEKPFAFVGGHPMAGTEKAGYVSSFAHLFENAYYILCPGKNSTRVALETISGLVGGIGAIPLYMNPVEHDRVTGCISHFPHIIASALVNLVRKAETPGAQMQILAAGGFRDITRIASSSPEMWENIVLSNKLQLEGILDTFVGMLETLKKSIQGEDHKEIREFFASAKQYRDLLPEGKKGLIAASHELIVDVVDKPGIIGEIATLLGNHRVNIKNIHVTNSREFEQGCLKITLPDQESVGLALELLSGNGYRVFRG
jgi:prephenate dehydrogenase